MKIEQRVVVLVKELDCGTAATRKKTIIIRLTKTVKDSVEQVFFLLSVFCGDVESDFTLEAATITNTSRLSFFPNNIAVYVNLGLEFY